MGDFSNFSCRSHNEAGFSRYGSHPLFDNSFSPNFYVPASSSGFTWDYKPASDIIYSSGGKDFYTQYQEDKDKKSSDKKGKKKQIEKKKSKK